MTEVIPIFAIPLVVDNIDHLITPELLEYTKNLDYEKVHIGSGDWSKDEDRNILNHEKFFNIKQYVLGTINKLARKVYLVDEDIEFEIISSWVLRHGHGHECMVHNHTGSLFSGVLYLNAPENCGDIKFHGQNAMGSAHAHHQISLPLRLSGYNVFNAPHYTVPVKTGMLMAFSSGLQHSVAANLSPQYRYSLSFNVLPKQMVNVREILIG